jgi:hypothetical protein
MTTMSPGPHLPKLSPSQHTSRGNSAAVAKVSRSGLTLSRLPSVQKVLAFCGLSNNMRVFTTLLWDRIVLNAF